MSGQYQPLTETNNDPYKAWISLIEICKNPGLVLTTDCSWLQAFKIQKRYHILFMKALEPKTQELRCHYHDYNRPKTRWCMPFVEISNTLKRLESSPDKLLLLQEEVQTMLQTQLMEGACWECTSAILLDKDPIIRYVTMNKQLAPGSYPETRLEFRSDVQIYDNRYGVYKSKQLTDPEICIDYNDTETSYASTMFAYIDD